MIRVMIAPNSGRTDPTLNQNGHGSYQRNTYISQLPSRYRSYLGLLEWSVLELSLRVLPSRVKRVGSPFGQVLHAMYIGLFRSFLRPTSEYSHPDQTDIHVETENRTSGADGRVGRKEQHIQNFTRVVAPRCLRTCFTVFMVLSRKPRVLVQQKRQHVVCGRSREGVQ